MLEQIPLPYSLFLIPWLLFKPFSPTVENVGNNKSFKYLNCKMLDKLTTSPLED
jgi:hypothetical protein